MYVSIDPPDGGFPEKKTNFTTHRGGFGGSFHVVVVLTHSYPLVFTRLMFTTHFRCLRGRGVGGAGQDMFLSCLSVVLTRSWKKNQSKYMSSAHLILNVQKTNKNWLSTSSLVTTFISCWLLQYEIIVIDFAWENLWFWPHLDVLSKDTSNMKL